MTTLTPEPTDRLHRRRLQNLLPLWIVLLGLAELAILIAIGNATSLWVPLLIVAVGWLIGVALIVAAGQQSLARIMDLVREVRGTGGPRKRSGRPAFTLIAAILFIIPGVLTAAAGAALLLPPVQKLFLKRTGVDAPRRTVLFNRARGGVIEGEIVVTPDPGTTGQSRSGPGSSGNAAAPPRVIESGAVRDTED